MSNVVPSATTALIRDNCLCLHTMRAARVLARRFDAALAPVGLTNGQFSLLNALNRAEPVPIGPVATLLAMDRTTLTAALKALERRGLVVITHPPQDRRRKRLGLTDAGHAVLMAAVPIWVTEHQALEQQLALDVKALRSMLRQIG